jgi:hypothetical protein
MYACTVKLNWVLQCKWDQGLRPRIFFKKSYSYSTGRETDQCLKKKGKSKAPNFKSQLSKNRNRNHTSHSSSCHCLHPILFAATCIALPPGRRVSLKFTLPLPRTSQHHITRRSGRQEGGRQKNTVATDGRSSHYHAKARRRRPGRTDGRSL